MNIALLREAMNKKRYTVNDLAQKMGLSYHTVRNWRKGRTSPNWLNASELCDLLDVRYDELMNEQLKPVPQTKARSNQNETIMRLNQVIASLAAGCTPATAISRIADLIQYIEGDV